MKSTYLILAFLIILASCTNPKTENNIEEDQTKVETEEQDIHIPKNQILTVDQQIASAIIAAPEQARNTAMVYGYDTDGNLIVLREGTDNFICIADNPKRDGFEVVAYHTSLEPYMARGRELNNEGKSRQEKEQVRSSEAKDGSLKMPENPATLHIYFGKDGYFNTETNKIENAKYRYVVYIPYATQESTGLTLSPNETGHPWLMFPSKYNAHIMISPKK
jgi:hypothetical protein